MKRACPTASYMRGGTASGPIACSAPPLWRHVVAAEGRQPVGPAAAHPDRLPRPAEWRAARGLSRGDRRDRRTDAAGSPPMNA
jgi:hypothetical protein